MIQFEGGSEPGAFGLPAGPGADSGHWARHTTRRTEFGIYRRSAPLGLA